MQFNPLEYTVYEAAVYTCEIILLLCWEEKKNEM